MFDLVTVGIAVVIIAVVGVAIHAASKPGTFRIARAATIEAPPEKIFPLIDDLRAHTSWSPFEKDPAMKRQHSGAPRGAGAVYDWDGNRKVGAGRITIVESTPPSRIVMKLDMFRPFEAHNIVEFTVEPVEDRTAAGGRPQADARSREISRVTWAMRGPQPFMAKLMGIFVNCDRMVGGEFEQGLAKLKLLAER